MIFKWCSLLKFTPEEDKAKLNLKLYIITTQHLMSLYAFTEKKIGAWWNMENIEKCLHIILAIVQFNMQLFPPHVPK